MDFNDVIAYSLRVGVLISAALLFIGFMLLLIEGKAGYYSINQIASTASMINSSYFNANTLIKGTVSMNPVAIMFLGLVVLIATPVLRVALGLAQFIREKDYIYSTITAIVLFNLLFAIFILPSFLHL
jgi:Predicted membrane protein